MHKIRENIRTESNNNNNNEKGNQTVTKRNIQHNQVREQPTHTESEWCVN